MRWSRKEFVETDDDTRGKKEMKNGGIDGHAKYSVDG
jgi:hypothetical protein